MGRLPDKHAIVTGAASARGLGEGLAGLPSSGPALTPVLGGAKLGSVMTRQHPIGGSTRIMDPAP